MLDQSNHPELFLFILHLDVSQCSPQEHLDTEQENVIDNLSGLQFIELRDRGRVSVQDIVDCVN